MVVFFAGYLLIFGWKLSVFVGAKQTTTFWDIPYFYLYLSTCVGGGLLLIQGILLLTESLVNSFGPSEK
jgi:TRAP-type C4-dicarboxylate transport system permease small subunit